MLVTLLQVFILHHPGQIIIRSCPSKHCGRTPRWSEASPHETAFFVLPRLSSMQRIHVSQVVWLGCWFFVVNKLIVTLVIQDLHLLLYVIHSWIVIVHIKLLYNCIFMAVLINSLSLYNYNDTFYIVTGKY